MKNIELRRLIEQANLHYWQVAEAVGIHPSTFCAWLRKDLQGDRLTRVQQAIEMLTKVGGEENERAEVG